MSEQTAAWLLEELYYSAYVNHNRLDDVAPGYEYVVQQLCDDIIRRTALCALDHLDTLETPPETVTLHDPQYHVDRDGLPDVGPTAVHIRCDVVGMAETIEAIRDAGELFPGQFRVSQ